MDFKKLLIVSSIFPPEIGGPASYLEGLITKLNTSYHISAVAFCSKTPKKFASIQTHILKIKQNFFSRQLNLLQKLAMEIPQANVIYLLDPTSTGFMSTLISKTFQKKTILKFVGDAFWEHERAKSSTDFPLEKFYNSLSTIDKFSPLLVCQRFVLKHSNRIIVPSTYLKSFLIKFHNIDPNKIHAIDNPVEVIPQKVNRSKNQLVVVGRLISWKNIGKIINAVRLARREKKWNLIIVGDGPEKQKLTSFTKLRKLDWIKFTGALSKTKTQRIIAQSTKLILFSDYEGQSHTLIEAFKLHTPIITTNIKPNKQLLRSASGSIFVKPHDEKALAKAINQTQPIKKLVLSRPHNWTSHTKSLNEVFSKV